ncbi:unnamed protein product [Gadus morhua 'NCC']
MGYSDVDREAFLLPVACLKDRELPGIQPNSDRQYARLPPPEVIPPPAEPPSRTTAPRLHGHLDRRPL